MFKYTISLCAALTFATAAMVSPTHAQWHDRAHSRGSHAGSEHFDGHYNHKSRTYYSRGSSRYYRGGLAYGEFPGILFPAPYFAGSDYFSNPDYFYAPDAAVAYCMQRFRSYDPWSGTYESADGYWRSCP